MSVSPLDMQVLFSNLKIVGQQHAAESNAEIVAQDKKADELIKKAEQKDHQVEESKDIETGVEKILEEERKQKRNSNNRENKQEKQKINETNNKEYIEDPDIGHNIDIIG